MRILHLPQRQKQREPREIQIKAAPNRRLGVRAAAILLMLVICYGVVRCVLIWPAQNGDAAIHYIYARNLAAGHFSQFNQGEITTGSTSPLWYTLLALFFKLWDHPTVLHAVKVFNLVLFVLLLLLLYQMGVKLSGSRWGGIIGAVLLAQYTYATANTVYCFEVVSFSLLAVSILLLLAAAPASEVSWRRVTAAGLLSGVLPLVRPEGFILAGVIASVWAWVHGRRGQWGRAAVPPLLIAAAIAVFSLPYYLFSLRATGHFFPVSALANLLCARADNLIPEGKIFSGQFLNSLWSTPPHYYIPQVDKLLIIVPGLLGLLRLRSVKAADSLVYPVAGAYLFCMAVFFSFVFPTADRIGRYGLPLMVLLAAVAAPVLARCIRFKTGRYVLVALLLIHLALSAALFNYLQRNHLLNDIDQVCLKKLASFLDVSTDAKDTILVREVQIKYFLNRRILSLDGVTDGKSIPYYFSDYKDFLWKYRPAYWVYIGGVHLNRVYENSLLQKVARLKDESVYLGGINFRLTRPNLSPLSTDEAYHYLRVYELSYLDRAD